MTETLSLSFSRSLPLSHLRTHLPMMCGLSSCVANSHVVSAMGAVKNKLSYLGAQWGCLQNWALMWSKNSGHWLYLGLAADMVGLLPWQNRETWDIRNPGGNFYFPTNKPCHITISHAWVLGILSSWCHRRASFLLTPPRTSFIFAMPTYWSMVTDHMLDTSQDDENAERTWEQKKLQTKEDKNTLHVLLTTILHPQEASLIKPLFHTEFIQISYIQLL